MAGDECDGAADLIPEVASLLQATVVATPQMKGKVSPYHPRFRGVVGFAGHSSATKILSDSEVDTVVVVGTRLGERGQRGLGESDAPPWPADPCGGGGRQFSGLSDGPLACPGKDWCYF